MSRRCTLRSSRDGFRRSCLSDRTIQMSWLVLPIGFVVAVVSTLVAVSVSHENHAMPLCLCGTVLSGVPAGGALQTSAPHRGGSHHGTQLCVGVAFALSDSHTASHGVCGRTVRLCSRRFYISAAHVGQWGYDPETTRLLREFSTQAFVKLVFSSGEKFILMVFSASSLVWAHSSKRPYSWTLV